MPCHESDTDDAILVFQTLKGAASRLAGLRDQHSIGGWLFRISGNLSRDRLLSIATLVERIAEIAKFEFLLSQPAVQHDTGSDLVRQAVRRLPPKRREVVALVSIKNKSHAGASQIAGCAESTVSRRLALIKRNLRNFLAP